MQKAIVIGSNGYLGRHLADYLQQHNYAAALYDLQEKSLLPDQPYARLDISNAADFNQLDAAIDYIFFMAGLTGTGAGFDRHEDFVRVNETGLLNLLQWMRKTGCRARIIYPSTRLIYKGVKDYALKESDVKETKTIYALNKLAAENLLWMYHNAFDLNYTIFRICVPYGNVFGGGFSYGTVGFFISQAQQQGAITIFGDGSIRRTFTHVSDIAAAMVASIQLSETENEIYNIGGENLSLRQAAQLVADKFGVQIKLVDWPKLALRLESDDTVFDDSKLRNAIGYNYRHNLAGWLKSWE
ncbi:MAG: NAD(P)-dependent oxidoreductase [Clostridia bacterium]|nr:NAD(P)-dependent oxidoreductase [Clostridia bacterium]